MISKKLKIRRFLFLLFLLLGSCQTTLSQVCTENLPLIISDIDSAKLALRPWNNQQNPTQERKLASHSTPTNNMSENEREKWIDWAEEKLLEAQSIADLIEQEPTLHQEIKDISNISNQIVSFHGYAQKGDGTHMVSILNQISVGTIRLKSTVCSSL